MVSSDCGQALIPEAEIDTTLKVDNQYKSGYHDLMNTKVAGMT